MEKYFTMHIFFYTFVISIYKKKEDVISRRSCFFYFVTQKNYVKSIIKIITNNIVNVNLNMATAVSESHTISNV